MTISPSVNVDREGPHRPRVVTVTVNYQRVELPERVMTGLEIKEAAIAQGVEIARDFQLSVKRGDRYDVVGDTDEVHVREREDFLAVAPDDNS